MTLSLDRDNEFDCLFKIVLIGDAGVGKSSVMYRFADDTFTPKYCNTIGVDFRIRTIPLQKKRLKLQIWDTAGSERFKSVTTSFYRGAHGIILAFDLTDQATFARLGSWISNMDSFAQPEAAKLLMGTKNDVQDARVVSYEDALAFAEMHGMQYIETSAKNNVNINHAFDYLSQEILRRIDARLISTNPAPIVKVKTGPPDGKIRSCCSTGPAN